MVNKVDLIGLSGFPLVKPGDEVAEFIIQSIHENSINLENGDIIVIAQSIISKSLGRIINLKDIKPSKNAIDLYNRMISKSRNQGLPIKSPELIQAILNESREVLETEHVMIVETNHGFICANAGIDKSNVEGEDNVSLLPIDADNEAETIRNTIRDVLKKKVAVIITDSFGRPFRLGSVGVAIGVAGISPLLDKRGSKDLFGNKLSSTIIGQIDNIAAAAQLIMGEADEGLPVVIIKGYQFDLTENVSIKSILRQKGLDLFRSNKGDDILKEIIRTRRSYKLNFSSKIVDKNIIKECIDTARWAPSAHNTQPWIYVILDKTELRRTVIEKMNEKLADDLIKDGKSDEFIRKKILKTRRNFLNAPFLILLCLNEQELIGNLDPEHNKNEYIMGVQSVSASIMCFLLALESKGLSSCWYCAPLFTPNILVESLKLNECYKPMAFVTIGYPENIQKVPHRKDLSDIIYEI